MRRPTLRKVVFTEHENDLVRLVSTGKNNRQVGEHFSIKESTVKNTLHKIMVKTGTTNRAHLVASFIGNGTLVVESMARLIDEDIRHLAVIPTPVTKTP